jgi:tetratricopeptide (TPR) repeat protein
MIGTMLRWFATAIVLWTLSTSAAESKLAAGYAKQLAQLQAQLESAPTNPLVLFQLADLCHDKGVEDDREAVKLAEQYLLRLMELEPTNAMARVLYGSTLTMKGRDAFWPPTQISLVKSGIKEMDAAVKMDTNSIRVRFARANNNFYMPKFLDRQEIVEADFAWLWQQVQAHPEGLDNNLLQVVALHRGQLLAKKKKVAEALPIWRQGLQIDPHSEAAVELKRELEKRKEP